MSSGLYSTTHSGSSFGMSSPADRSASIRNGHSIQIAEWLLQTRSFFQPYLVTSDAYLQRCVDTANVSSIISRKIQSVAEPLSTKRLVSVRLSLRASRQCRSCALARNCDEGDGHKYLVAAPYHRCSEALQNVPAVFLLLYVIEGRVLLAQIVLRSGVTSQDDAVSSPRR
eukprot:ANDGO_01321.mRNA.1 hypothetical protein